MIAGQSLAVVAAALLAASSAAPEPGAARHEEARYLMGTLAVVQARAADAPRAEAAVAAAWAAMVRVDSLMSTWRDDSDLARVNAGAAAAPVAVDPETAAVVAAALDMAAASAGAFDPTMLPLMRAWGLRGDGPARAPGAADLAAVLSVTGARLVSVDTAASTIALDRPGVELDLGGIAKGHALDAAAAAMRAAGADGGLLDLGGNLLAFGSAAGDSVAVVAPDAPDRILATLAFGAGAVATSGQYERFVTIDGQPHGHILDPRNGRPVPRLGSVTVTAPSGRLADALATAVFVLGPEQGMALAARYAGTTCLIVASDGEGGWSILRSAAPGAARSR